MHWNEKFELEKKLNATPEGNTRSMHVPSHKELIKVTRVDEAHWLVKGASVPTDLTSTLGALKALWENGEVPE